MEVTNEFVHLSSPLSPENMQFYSVPASPRAWPSPSEPPSPVAYEDANSTLDEFEFETSHHFDLRSDIDSENVMKFESLSDQNQKSQRGGSPPGMAFADELFCDGKVLPLLPPLKLPPRLLNGNNNKIRGQSSTASSPRSPNSALKIKFPQRSLWNDDFDPFLEALETVKEENEGKSRRKNLRQARSLPPLKAVIPQRPNVSSSFNHCPKEHISGVHAQENLNQQSQTNSNSSQGFTETFSTPPHCPKQRLAEPRGVEIARRVRMEKIGHDNTTKPKTNAAPEPVAKHRESDSESGDCYTRERKRDKIRRFFFKIAYVTARKPTYFRKLSRNSGRSARRNENKLVSRVTQTALVQFRPRLFLCLGFSRRFPSKWAAS